MPFLDFSGFLSRFILGKHPKSRKSRFFLDFSGFSNAKKAENLKIQKKPKRSRKKKNPEKKKSRKKNLDFLDLGCLPRLCFFVFFFFFRKKKSRKSRKCIFWIGPWGGHFPEKCLDKTPENPECAFSGLALPELFSRKLSGRVIWGNAFAEFLQTNVGVGLFPFPILRNL